MTEQADPVLSHIATLLDAGQAAEACALALPLADERPDEAAIWRLLGRAYQGMGQNAAACAALVEATWLAPDDAMAQAALAEALAAGHRWLESLAAAGRVPVWSPSLIRIAHAAIASLPPPPIAADLSRLDESDHIPAARAAAIIARTAIEAGDWNAAMAAYFLAWRLTPEDLTIGSDLLATIVQTITISGPCPLATTIALGAALAVVRHGHTLAAGNGIWWSYAASLLRFFAGHHTPGAEAAYAHGVAQWVTAAPLDGDARASAADIYYGQRRFAECAAVHCGLLTPAADQWNDPQFEAFLDHGTALFDRVAHQVSRALNGEPDHYHPAGTALVAYGLDREGAQLLAVAFHANPDRRDTAAALAEIMAAHQLIGEPAALYGGARTLVQRPLVEIGSWP
jgi:tetratricopeptide (TPR) repeat protein